MGLPAEDQKNLLENVLCVRKIRLHRGDISQQGLLVLEKELLNTEQLGIKGKVRGEIHTLS
jgi:hypothetical protein